MLLLPAASHKAARKIPFCIPRFCLSPLRAPLPRAFMRPLPPLGCAGEESTLGGLRVLCQLSPISNPHCPCVEGQFAFGAGDRRRSDWRRAFIPHQYRSSRPSAGALISANGRRAFASSQSTKDRASLSFRKPVDVLGIRSSETPSTNEITCGESITEVMLPLMYHESNFLKTSLLEQGKEGDETAYALVVLNYQMPAFTLLLWSRAFCRICADGGANQIYDCIPRLLACEDPVKIRERYKPDFIIGDLDSIRPEVKDFYIGLGTKILEDSQDQDTTDLHKCVSYLKDTIPIIQEEHVKLIVLGGMGGRLDHQFANINALYLFPKIRIILLSDESMAFLLQRNFKHEILIDPSIEGPYCGILPLTGPSDSTTTTGLKWNLDKSSMQFGGMISTSNIQINNKVTIHSDTDLLWTISLQSSYKYVQQHCLSDNEVKRKS